MTNVLEDMKAVYRNEVCEVSTILSPSKNECGWYYLKGHSKYGDCHVSDQQVKPLLKFPDKDSEGQTLHVGDLVTTFNDDPERGDIWDEKEHGVGIVAFEPYKGFYIKDCRGNYGWSFDDEDNVCHLKFLTRKCSIYDKEALDHLPEDVVSKLKEEVVK